jgi:hypothetical protein
VIDPVSMVVGVGLVAAGVAIGKISKRTRHGSEPICGCGHSLAEHERDTDKCHGENPRDRHHGWAGQEWVPCTCQRYVGPLPIGSLWTPPILPPKEDQ